MDTLLEGLEPGGVSRFPDIHLQSPLRPHARTIFIKIYDTLQSRASVIRKDFPSWIYNAAEHLYDLPFRRALRPTSEKRYGYYFSGKHVLKQPQHRLERYVKDLDLTFSIGYEFLGAIQEKYRTPIAGQRMDICRYTPPKGWNKLYTNRLYWEGLRDLMYKKVQAKDSSWSSYKSDYSSLNVLFSSNYVVDRTSSISFLLDYDQVCGICDTIISRFLTLTYCWLSPLIGVTRLPSIKQVINVWKVFDDLFDKLGNDTYKYVKFWEPIWAGKLIQLGGTLPSKEDFLQTMMQEIVKLDKENNTTIAPKLTDLLREVNDSAVASEMHGMFRFWMHPTVQEEAGCEKMKKRARQHPPKNTHTLRLVKGVFCRLFVSQFISRHGRWPKCYLNDTAPVCDDFKKLVKSKPIHFRDTHISDNLYKWSFLHFEKELEFDYQTDYTELLEDKAISLPRDFFDCVYDHSLLGYTPPTPEQSRRLMELILKTETLDIEDICRRIQSTLIPFIWYIVGVHAKERELKLDPRLFAMMVLEMRCYFAVTEKNLATFFEYIPYQTMTMSESELLHHLMEVTSTDIIHKSMRFFVNIDFEGWCNTWDMKSTNLIFESLDEIFGVPGLYVFSHKFFSEAYFYLVSHLYPPSGINAENRLTYIETATTWRGQAGGCEGLRQKGWTLITICLLLLVQTRTGIRASITGQGDNQVLTLDILLPAGWEGTVEEYKITHPTAIQQTLKAYMDVLVETAEEIGLPIKREETWISENVLMYSKDVFFRGAIMPSTIKRISRLFGEVNELYPSLSSKVSTLHTCGQAAAQKGIDPLIPYTMVGAEVLKTFTSELTWSHFIGNRVKRDTRLKVSMLDDDQRVIILTIPRCLGGLPVSPLTEYIYRGHPDPLTSALVYLTNLQQRYPIITGALNFILNKMDHPSPPDYRMLIQDPVSLNVHVPVLSSNILKNTIQRVVIPQVTNQDIKTLFHAAYEHEEKELIDFLMTVRPIAPRVLNDIYRSTPMGVRTAFISKFDNMRTTKMLLSVYEQVQLIDKMQMSEVAWIKLLFDIKKKYISHKIKPLCGCTRIWAQQLRERTWELDEAPLGVTVPHPCEQFQLVKIVPECCSICDKDNEYVLFVCAPDEDVLYTRGNQKAYTGSRTSEKVASRLMISPQTDKPLIAAQRLLRVREWLAMYKGSFWQLLTDLINLRTDIPIDVLSLMTGVHYGGSHTHRFDDVTTKHLALVNQRPNIHTHVYLSSDLMGKFSRGFDNYTMHFQGIFLWSISLIGRDRGLINIEAVPTTYHSHIACSDCCELLVEPPLSTERLAAPVIHPFVGSKLIYSSVTDTGILSKSMTQQHIQLVSVDQGQKKDPGQIFACMLYGDALRRRGFNIFFSDEASLTSRPPFIHPSIADVLGLGIDAITTACSELLFIDMLPLALSIHKRSSIPLSEVFVGLLVRFIEILWEPLLSILLLPDFELVSTLGEENLPSSSEYHVKGYSLQMCLTRITMKKIQRILENKRLIKFTYASTRGFGALKIVKNWATLLLWNFWCANNSLLSDMLPLVHSLHKALDKSEDPLILADRIIISVLTPKGLGEVARNGFSTQKCRVSTCGPEVWLSRARSKVKIKRHIRFYEGRPQTLQKTVPQRVVQLPPLGNQIFELKPLVIMNQKTMPENKSRADHYFREIGIYSTAPYKYLEILGYLEVHIVDYAICLAEGSGGLCRMFLDVFESKTVMYNSLRSIFDHLPHRGVSYYPAEIERSPHRDHMIGISTSLYEGGDLTKSLVQNSLISLWNKSTKFLADVITCDAETSGDFDPMISLEICRAAIRISSKCLKTSGYLIFKTFCNRPELLEAQIHLISLLGHTTLMIPTFSSNESHEVFLVTQKMYNVDNRSLGAGSICPILRLLPNLTEICHQLAAKRREAYPFQYRNRQQAEYLSKTLRDVGFENNGLSSYRRLTAELDYQSLPTIEELDNRCLMIERIVTVILHERLTSFRALVMSTPHYRSRIVRAQDHVECRAIIREFKALINMRLLVLWSKGISLDQLMSKIEEPVALTFDSELAFVLSLTQEEWTSHYARAFWHCAKAIGLNNPHHDK